METLAPVKIYKSETPWVVRASGGIVAETRNALTLTIDGQPDIIFFPIADVALPLFDPSESKSHDLTLGEVNYYHLAGKSNVLENVAWQITNPKDRLSKLAGYMAFETSKVAVEAL